MKLKVLREHEVVAATDSICGACPQIESDWPQHWCKLFEAKLELSESEDVHAYLRTDECRRDARAVPALAAAARAQVDIAAPSAADLLPNEEEDEAHEATSRRCLVIGTQHDGRPPITLMTPEAYERALGTRAPLGLFEPRPMRFVPVATSEPSSVRVANILKRKLRGSMNESALQQDNLARAMADRYARGLSIFGAQSSRYEPEPEGVGEP